MSAPLSAVLAQVAQGTPTVIEMARNTGLEEGLLRSALDHLVRTGRLEAHELPIGCPPAGCGACSSSSACAGPTPPGNKRLVSLHLPSSKTKA